MTPALEANVEHGLAFLSTRLPDPLRAPGVSEPVKVGGQVVHVKGSNTLTERDAEIRRAVNAGIPTVDVARTWGLSVSQVNRRANKEAA